MGKLDVSHLSFLNGAEIRILQSLERCMRTNYLTPAAKVAQLASLRHGGVSKLLRDLTKLGLLCYERGKRYDGYRLTNKGYDYLALHELVKKKNIDDFGRQIGVGKESNIYIVRSTEKTELCLKLHRLGRTSFRNIKSKRDYHKNRTDLNWLELSKISATKEFAYMKALHERGFPIPQPIACDRHIVVMELIDGILLNNVLELDDVEALYDELMNLILRMANAGVIHGDFNEYNIILTEDEKPIIIDFPQMVSTMHANAEMYFNRDVACIQKLFKRKFHFESESHPTFSDVERSDALDCELRCSGLTKEMAQAINKELGLVGGEESSETTDAENSDTEDSEVSVDNSDEDLENDDNQEEAHKEVEIKTTEWLKGKLMKQETKDSYVTLKEELPSETRALSDNELEELTDEVRSLRMESGDESGDYSNTSNGPCGSRPQSISEKSDLLSVASTFELYEHDMRGRVKKQVRNKINKQRSRRCVAKGEANAVTRTRRDNQHAIKSSGSDIWG